MIGAEWKHSAFLFIVIPTMGSDFYLTFPSLSAQPGFAHAFTLRHPEVDVAVDREEALRRLGGWHADIAQELGFQAMTTAQQVHGHAVAVARRDRPETIADVDGLIGNEPGLLIGIYVADCCAVYLLDLVRGAFGVVHSGKKGTEQNITGQAISLMGQHFGSQAGDMIVQLSPCIRPPMYEVDFAASIRAQARDAGVPASKIHDDGTCTSDASRFYSYRVEKGKTGRMLALMGRLPA